MTEPRIRLLLELEPPSDTHRFRATVEDAESSRVLVFDSALDLVGWLEARSGKLTQKGLR